MPRTASSASAASSKPPSTSASSNASAPAGKPIAMKRSHASITMRSIISSAAGTMPAPMISPTASAAARTVGKAASSVSVRSGSGSSFTVARVITPRFPSLPVTSASTS
jgi:hypothetical protein